ncbi:MAG: NAD(P)H-hydrate dehydratase [Chlorobi bacterium]|nr:NAD(P)H-hydrate dehydratase [Chlorobiota bacterium]
MLPVVTAAEMAAADRAAIEQLRIGEIRLMELAGARSADIISDILERNNVAGCTFLAVCGKGNNGGDGLVLARHLLNQGASVDVVLLYPDEALSPVNRNALEILDIYRDRHAAPLRMFHGISEVPPFVMESVYDALIDAVLGTGLKIGEPGQALHAPVREGIELLEHIRRRNGTPLIALDVPSGLDATSGFAADPAVTADSTVTMAFLKTGFFFNEGPRHSGEVRRAEISIPEFLIAPSACRLIDQEYASGRFILREPSGAKHLNGKVLVIAGSLSSHASMLGAAIMSVKAALKAGAGYVCASVPIGLADVMHAHAPEAVVIAQEKELVLEKARWADCVLLGCGLGREPDNIAFMRELLGITGITAGKLVLDADALYAISGTNILEESLDPVHILLTPHYGEFSRLSGIAVEDISADPLSAAAAFARKHRVNLLLKGHPTVLAGAGGELMINDSGTEALSTAGSGDVLAGMTAALAAKGVPVLEAGAAAAWFHGRAGDLANEIASLVCAGDILDAIPAAIREIFDLGEKPG